MRPVGKLVSQFIRAADVVAKPGDAIADIVGTHMQKLALAEFADLLGAEFAADGALVERTAREQEDEE